MNMVLSQIYARSITHLQRVIDIVFPPHARALSTRLYARRRGSLPLRIRTDIRLDTRITSITEYERKPVQTAIQALKYNAEPTAIDLLAHALNDYLQEEVAQRRLFSARDIAVVAVPLHATRLRERGFNQIDKILARYSTIASDPLPVLQNLLVRTRETTPQTHLSRAKRLRNVENAFAVISDRSLVSFHIYLLDDVTTTGSTLLYAGRALEERGARVTRVAISRA